MVKKDDFEPANNQVVALRLVFAVLIILVAVKFLWINRPDETPREISNKVISYLQTENPTSDQKEELRKYFDYEPQFMSSSSDADLSSAVVSIRSIDEQDNTATVTTDIESSLAKTPFQLKFVKKGNIWSGYRWVINSTVGP